MWRPYQLGFSNGFICIAGSIAELESLLTLPNATLHGRLNNPDSYVYFKASRLGFIVAEAIGAPVKISKAYLDARKQYLETSVTKHALRLQQLRELFQAPLSSHQLEAISTGIDYGYLFNASEQGTGKTRTSIGMFTVWDSQRILVVTGRDLVEDPWLNELRTCLAPKTYDAIALIDIPVRERQEQLRDLIKIKGRQARPVIVFTNYEVLAALEPLISRWSPDCLVFDESYSLKNPKAKVTKAALKLTDMVTNVILMTGTPVGSHAGDLYTQCKLSQPTSMTYYDWMHEYCVLKDIKVGARTIQKAVGSRNLVGLFTKLIGSGWYRATKASSLDLPEKVRERVWLTMNPAQQLMYADLTRRGEQALGKDLALTDERVVLLRKQQLVGGWLNTVQHTDHAELAIDDEGDLITSQLLLPGELVTTSFGSPKLNWLKEFAQQQLVNDHSIRVIIWCRFNLEIAGITAMLQEVLGDNRVVGVTAKTKNLDEIKESFNSRSVDGVQVIVGQIAKMHKGHNLQAGDWNIYYSHTWSLPMKLQSEDRTHRQGRQGVVRYVELCCRDSVDKDIMTSMDNKQSFFEHFSSDTVALPREKN